jgi:hypothetical protein
MHCLIDLKKPYTQRDYINLQIETFPFDNEDSRTNMINFLLAV